MKKIIILILIIFLFGSFNFSIFYYTNIVSQQNNELKSIVQIQNTKEIKTIKKESAFKSINKENILSIINNYDINKLYKNHNYIETINNFINKENIEIQNQINNHKKELERLENLKIQKEIEEKGIYTRLKIPSVGVNVAVYKTSFYDINVQTIVDNNDSASLQNDEGVCGVIADHKHQGFSATKNSVPNVTYAYFDFGTYKEKYICIKKCLGTNNESLVIDDEGIWIAEYPNADIAMYTCNENWRNVTITYWKKIQEL